MIRNLNDTSAFYKLTHKPTGGRTKPQRGIAGSNDLRFKDDALKNPQTAQIRGEHNKAVHEEMGKWLLTFPWQWYATLTFRPEFSMTATGGHTLFRQYVKWAGEKTNLPVYAFRADEYGELYGRFHLHALMGNVGDLPAYCGERLSDFLDERRQCCATHGWSSVSKRCGFATVYPFTPDKGAAFYVTKYITKANGDWEIVGDPRNHPFSGFDRGSDPIEGA